jgi:para-nitrobenzyl esterase
MSISPNPVVETCYGKMQGTLENGLQVFKGIPYAEPPVGQLRWRAPRPPQPWGGIRAACDFGAIALQPTLQLSNADPNLKPERQSEDCLFLNVFTPGTDGRQRPVMVWIHGGAFHMGSGSSLMHPGQTLPKRGGVVFVSLNYRLGPLGFLNLDQATRGEIPSTGNEGLLDQVAALRWVRDNIAAFGGDPGNVTVFGESAGAMSIGCLLAMPLARGLFQKAILQSGVSTVRNRTEAAATVEKYLAMAGAGGRSGTDLLACPGEKLVQKEAEMVGPNLWSLSKGAAIEPVVEGDILPALPLTALAGGSAREVTVLAGSTLDEATIFTAANLKLPGMTEKELVSRLVKILPRDFVIDLLPLYRSALTQRGLNEVKACHLYHAIFSDLQFRMPAVRLMEYQTGLKQKAFHYIFDWPSSVPGLGACHSIELGFLFGNYRADFHGQGPAAARLAEQVQGAWTAFAHHGDPSCDSLGNWPAYGTQRATMLLGARSRIENDPLAAERSAWNNTPDLCLG